MSRFDYVKYDETAAKDQSDFKQEVERLEVYIETNLKSPRYKAIALTKLEECYMFIGKAIRDDQIERGKVGICAECQGNPSYFAQYNFGEGPKRCLSCGGAES